LYDLRADANPAVLVAGTGDRYVAALAASGDPTPSRAEDIPDAVKAVDAMRYLEHDGPESRELAAADLAFMLLGDRRQKEGDGAAPAPTQGPGPGTPAESRTTLTWERRSRADRADGGADEPAAGADAAPPGGTAERAADDDDAEPAALLVVDWASPDLREDLTPLHNADLAFVPTYVPDGAPRAAPARPADSAADVALAGVVVGPDQAPAVGGGAAAASADGDHAPAPIYKAPSLPPDTACMRRAPDLRSIAAETGRLLANLPRLFLEDRTAAAAVLAETLVVLGVWRATKPGRRS
jgi:hypothetical protein